MPTIHLTHQQLKVIAAALNVALKADEEFALEAARTDGDYRPMSGPARRELAGLWAHLDAVARTGEEVS